MTAIILLRCSDQGIFFLFRSEMF